MNDQFVVCAAVRFKCGLIVSGPRHFDKIMNDVLRMMPNLDKSCPEEGFIDQFGTFLDRTEALYIVINNDQPLDKERNDARHSDMWRELYSEGLY